MNNSIQTELRGLPAWWSVEKFENSHQSACIDIYIDSSWSEYKESDSYQGERLHDYRPYRSWRHLNIMQYQCYLKARLPRLRDSQGKIKSVQVPWASPKSRTTYLFEQHAINVLLATKNQTKSANLLECGFNVINRIIHQATERGLSRRQSEQEYRQLSIDEKAFKKGHQYVSVLSSPETGHIIDVGECRTLQASSYLRIT